METYLKHNTVLQRKFTGKRMFKCNFWSTVRALSSIDFGVFSHFGGVELCRGVTSIFVLPCRIR